MKRYRRNREQGGSFFFTVVTARREPILGSEDVVRLLAEGLRQERLRRPMVTEALVVLPDHLHCMWRLPAGDSDYSSRWREVKKWVTRRIDTSGLVDGKVWQDRFWEHTVRNEEDWRRHIDYIHYNPVRHGHVLSPAEWPWSTFHRAVKWGWYDGKWGIQVPDGLMDMDCE